MTRTTKRSAALVVVLALAATAMIAALTAGTAGAATKIQNLKLSAKPGMLAFSTTKLKAHTGTVRITLVNPKNSGISHGIAVSGHGINRKGQVVAPGKDSVVTVTLTKKGTYTFFCPVPGHEMAGMKGTLTVS
jgi:uncharacterized cupredoxin-like copper-binding protein